VNIADAVHFIVMTAILVSIFQAVFYDVLGGSEAWENFDRTSEVLL
jgi:hypothetical protein